MAEDIPSTSSSLLNIATTEQLLEQLDVQSVAPWVSEKLESGEIQFKLWDSVHSIAKYTVNLNSSLEFTVYL